MKCFFDFQRKHYDIIFIYDPYSLGRKPRKVFLRCRYCGLERKTEEAMYKHIIRDHYKGDVEKAWSYEEE